MSTQSNGVAKGGEGSWGLPAPGRRTANVFDFHLEEPGTQQLIPVLAGNIIVYGGIMKLLWWN